MTKKVGVGWNRNPSFKDNYAGDNPHSKLKTCGMPVKIIVPTPEEKEASREPLSESVKRWKRNKIK